MTEQSFDTDSGDTEDRTVTLSRSQIKSIEKKAKAHDEALARAEAAERRLAFAEAGLPMGDRRIQFFVKGYDGELSKEAILAAAVENGFVTEKQVASPDTPGQTTVDEQVERQTLDAVYSASQGAGAPAPQDIEAGMQKAMQEGGQEGLVRFLKANNIPVADSQ